MEDNVTHMERISVRVPETYREQMEAIAARLDRQPSWVYRQAIKTYIAVHGSTPEDVSA